MNGPTETKISRLKSQKFIPQALILIILVIIVILGILVFVWPKKEAPPSELPDEKTAEERLRESLTVPEENRNKIREFSPEEIEALTVPNQ